jgi:hypothetical protein
MNIPATAQAYLPEVVAICDTCGTDLFAHWNRFRDLRRQVFVCQRCAFKRIERETGLAFQRARTGVP